MTSSPIVELKNISVKLGDKQVHHNLSLSINAGEIIGIVGRSGSGKTTLLREMLMLQKPDSGSLRIFGEELLTASHHELLAVQKRWGVLLQQNALFSSLTVIENVQFPLKEHADLSDKLGKELALQRILSVGLGADVANQYPAELSGGMEKRAALARAIVLDPELLFLDEPTAGLDPDSAAALDDLVLNLRDTMGLTIIIITHDLDTLWQVTDRVAFLQKGKVYKIAPIRELIKDHDPEIQEFFNGPRGRNLRESDQHGN